jgi:hypothetical protein
VRIENLEQLAGTLEAMDIGQRLDVRGRFETLWPNPPWPLADDHLQPQERAEQWCKHFGCIIREMIDPPCLQIEKAQMQEPVFRGFRPAEPTIDERTRADLRSYFAEGRSPSVKHYGEPDPSARIWHWAEQTEDGSELTGRTGTCRGSTEMEALDRLRLDQPEIGRITWTKTERPDLGFIDKMETKVTDMKRSIHKSNRAEGNNFVD